MDAQKVDLFIVSNSKFFEDHYLSSMRDELLKVDESKWVNIASLQFFDPIASIIISVFAGGLGIDRIVIGDIGLGIGKMLTCGGLGIWAIVDLFLIMDATREKNRNKLLTALNF